MIIFAVETSCDETSICILTKNKDILSHIIYTQSEHQKYGGVIPELASRSHLQILQKITKDALLESGLDISEIDIFSATCGPGLIGGLIVGSTFTKSLAVGLNKPFIPINHLEGHLLSSTFNNEIKYPFLSFLLTGGHTQIYLINSIDNYVLLGETLDDAIGEAFDKVAKLLSMPYPGGPEIEKIALEGNPFSFNLPEPLQKTKNLNFSFSGIKTAINLIVKKQKKIDKKFIADLSASFQYTLSKILNNKLKIAISLLNNKNIKISQIALVGGVARNNYLKESIKKKFL
jgi:N6-L-threonylcarbamoyladenine synthase